MLLYQGRSDLLTVTSAETLDAHGPLRERAASLDAAARACDAVARLFETDDPSPAVFHLLANELRLLDDDERAAGAAHQLAFRLKLLVAGGFTPQLATCASCGEADHLSGFSGRGRRRRLQRLRGVRVPARARRRTRSSSPRSAARWRRRRTRARARSDRPSGRSRETAEHHAHVRLAPAAARGLSSDRLFRDQAPA